MKLVCEQYEIRKSDKLTVEDIEKVIKTSGASPLRWSIVKSTEDYLTVDAVVIIE